MSSINREDIVDIMARLVTSVAEEIEDKDEIEAYQIIGATIQTILEGFFQVYYYGESGLKMDTTKHTHRSAITIAKILVEMEKAAYIEKRGEATNEIERKRGN